MAFLGGRSGLLAALVLVTGLSACAPSFRNHGYVPRDDQLAQIQVGRDTRASVVEKIGGPVVAGLKRNDAWYWVESRFRHVPIRAPEEIERRVLRISFNAAGRVSNIETFGLEAGRVVRLTTRVTETGARGTGFIAQLLGNLGGSPGPGAFLN